MSDFKVLFNGADITEYLRVTSLDRGVGVDNTVEMVKVGVSEGKHVKTTTFEEKIIPMGFVLRYDLVEKRRELARLLSVKKPAKLIFTDEPDKYYLALPIGDIPLDENNFLGKGIINWLVPEGVAYSVEEKSVEDVDGLVNLDYKGTADTSPRFEIDNPTTNGFIALINQNGKIIQLGEPEETDLVPYKRNERAIKEPFNADTGKWTPNIGVISYPFFLSDKSVPNKIEGSYNWNKVATTIVPVFKANTAKVWSFPTLHRAIPATSEGKRDGNFQTKTRVHFYQRKVNEKARMEVIVQSDNKILAGITLRDSSASKKELLFDCHALGKRLGTFTLNPKIYFGGFYELEITKMGNNFSFKISLVSDLTGKAPVLKNSFRKSWTLMDYKKENATAITLSAGKFSNEPVNEVHFTDFLFDWINVDKMADVPNSFNVGDSVVVDNSSGSVTLNDVLNYNLGVPGNEFFKLENGENEIQVVWSDWADKPSVKMFYRERWK